MNYFVLVLAVVYRTPIIPFGRTSAQWAPSLALHPGSVLFYPHSKFLLYSTLFCHKLNYRHPRHSIQVRCYSIHIPKFYCILTYSASSSASAIPDTAFRFGGILSTLKNSIEFYPLLSPAHLAPYLTLEADSVLFYPNLNILLYSILFRL